MRRFVTMGSTLALLLGLGSAGRLVAQEEKPAEAAPAPAATPAPEAAPAPAPAQTPAPAASTAPAEIPAEVKAKIDAALKAVAEAIAAAEKAGLVKTNVEPPPILDILINGQATDATELEAGKNSDKQIGLLSPEAFGAYFTGFASAEGIVPQTNVRIRQPSLGLKEFYDKRAAVLKPFLEEARKAAGVAAPGAAAPAATEAPAAAEAPKAEEPKPAEEAKPAEEPKTEEAKPAEEPKPAEEAKPAEEPKTEEPKPAEEAKPAEEPKTEEPKA